MVHGGVQGGIGGGPINFQAQKPLSDRGWRLRLLDRPGFGASPSRGPDDMEVDGSLIADLLDEECHLIGHSFGGASSLLAAAQRPENVRSLILIEPALKGMLMVDPVSQQDGTSAKVAEVVMKHLMTARTPAEFALSFVGSMGSSAQGEANVSTQNIMGDPAKATALGCSLLRSRAALPQSMLAAADIVRERAIPTLVISGGFSPGFDATCAAVARLTGGMHEVVACSSHFVQQDSAERFNALADAFMKQAETRPGRGR
ncbi:alpha/beta fold hydrolase [Sphingobium fluviale]|nr:alpha/beta hydrolase [Sphingobium fluviale]